MGRKLGPAALLDEADVRGLLGVCSRRAPTGVRDHALITTLWRTGLRISEALALEARDVSLSAAKPTLGVRDSKTDSGVRRVGVHADVAAAVGRWLEVRGTLGLGRRGPLFCTLAGERLSDSHVRAMLRRRRDRAGLDDTRVHPHAFRASLAVNLMREGNPLPVIRDVLGHASLAGTDAYLRRLAPDEAIDAVIRRDRDPRAELLARLDDATAQRLLTILNS